MEITFIQLTKDELTEIIKKAVQEAMPGEFKVVKQEPFIKGIHELAKFLKVSTARAQKLKNEGAIPYYQNERLVLFDPEKVRIAMHEHNNLRKRRK